MQKNVIKGVMLGVGAIVVSSVLGKYVPFMKI